MVINQTPQTCDSWSPFCIDSEPKDVETSLFWRFLPEDGMADHIEVVKEGC